MQAPRHAPLIVLLLVAAGAAGFGVYQWMASGPAPQANPAAMPAPGAKAMTAADALNLKFDGLDGGGSHRLSDWKGKAVLVNFWATWCAPCRQEIPLLVQLQAKFGAQGLQVVGIATDETDSKDVQAFLKRMVVNYPMLMGTEDVGSMVSAFGGTLIGLPYTLVLDRTGKVLDIHAGELSPEEAQRLVDSALTGTPLPASTTPPASATAAASVAK